ncbi:MAG: putative sulfate/molybdate transporter [Halodesulfurarchaeum sp.]
MAFSVDYSDDVLLEFSLGELTGALGDSVTVLPVVVAISLLTDVSLTTLLLGFAVFQLVWGLHYGLPISVEPMKALAALVIAGSLTASELAVSGLLAGGILLAVGTTGTLDRLSRFVGQPVARGVQLAVGLVLLETGVQLGFEGVFLALAATGIAAIVIGIGHFRASALAVLLVGFLFALWEVGLPGVHAPQFELWLPATGSITPNVLEATAAQLAMTIGNAAVATSLLLSEYFDSDVSPGELSTSMGVMNLTAIPFGAMPMCHGSGGVAGKYAFGARTAGSNVILAGVYAGIAVVAVDLLVAFPVSMLGVVLALIAIELGRAALDTDHLPMTLAIGALGLLANVGVAFIAGVIAYILVRRRANGTVTATSPK